MTALIVLCVLQAVLIFIDEYLHHQRGLPRWERIGHPFDTLVVLSAFIVAMVMPYGESSLQIFIGIALLSCVLITKDEWIHQKHCGGFELWLHSVLFILHPLLFIALALEWKEGASKRVIATQCALISSYFCYQVVYWSFLGKSKWTENLKNR